MTRIKRIKAMSAGEIAKEIIELNFTDDYCKSDCERCGSGEDFPCLPEKEKECCIKWLKSEMEG